VRGRQAKAPPRWAVALDKNDLASEKLIAMSDALKVPLRQDL